MEPAGTMTAQRDLLLARLEDARARTDDLFRIVRPEALYDRPIRERHRIVFYVGHLEAFDWNLIARRTHGVEPFDPALDQLFAFGIDPVDGQLPNDQPSQWPTWDEVLAYNRRVRETIDGLLQKDSGDTTVYEVAIEHRLMHAETLAYMLHQLPLDRKIPQSDPEPARGRAGSGSSMRIPAGTATLGLARNGGAFGWDNEFEQNTVEVPEFAIDSLNVTNGEFLEFLRDGGYERRELWSEDAWRWIQDEKVRHPAFWRPEGDSWVYRGMFAEILLPLDRPAYVSQAEATAFARGRGKTLPTEAQFHRAAYGTREGSERGFPWGEGPPDASKGNFDFARWEPAPVGAYPAGDSAFGVADLVGNGWEWTSSVFAPFPGFTAFPFYAGYSANFFDGKHYVMKGGSSRTAACMLRRSFRNWFQPHYPYVYAAFRCVEGAR